MYNLWIVAIVVAIIEIAFLILHLAAKSLNWFDVKKVTGIALFLCTVLLIALIVAAITNPLNATDYELLTFIEI